jgi:NAD(P)-dependent dehydrogenase (short-subunit alcohol dehydrogenase family)
MSGQTIPSWYLVGTADRIIPPAEQRIMARRAHAHTVEIRASHLSMISHPDAVTHLVEQAAHSTTSRVRSGRRSRPPPGAVTAGQRRQQELPWIFTSPAGHGSRHRREQGHRPRRDQGAGAARPRLGGVASVTDEDWTTALTINFLAAVRATRAALPHLLARGTGTIVTVSSVNSFLPDPLVVDYSAAKTALANFLKSLSKEVGPKGVRVNTVSPGPVATGLWLGDDGVAATVAKAAGGRPEDVAEHAAAASMTGRFTRPEEVADLVLLLASDRAGNVTGADFVIDGGLISTL